MNNITDIDGNKSKRMIVEEMSRLLGLKESKAPRKPPRIVLMGPPGVELENHAAMLSAKYKIQNIDMQKLIQQHIKEEGEGAEILKHMLEKSHPLDDELVMRVLKL